MATALISALTGVPVRRSVAMTGEITLRGRVLPIGGVKEKVLGAHRAGITDVILPQDNELDLEDVPEETRSALRFHFADTLDDVLRWPWWSTRRQRGSVALRRSARTGAGACRARGARARTDR